VRRTASEIEAGTGDGVVKEPSGLHPAWVILGICFVDLFVNYSVRLGYGVVLPEMIRTLGFSRADGGSIYNAYLLTYIIVTPFTGYLTDRLGARRVISVCLVLLGSGVLLLGTAEHLWSAGLFFGLAGLGASGLWVPIITLVQRWFSYRRKGLALGVLSTGYGLGFAVMGAAFPWVVGHYSWRHAWFILGMTALALVVPNALALRSDPADRGLRPWGYTGSPQPAPGKSLFKVPLRHILRNPNFWMIGASYFFLSYGLYGFTTFMVDYATYQLNVPLEQASLLASIHGFCQILGVLTVLPLSDYAGRKRTVLFSNTVITLLLSALLFAGGSWSLLCMITGVMAVFYAATFPIYGACAGDYFPREAMGTVAGAWTPFYGSGAILTHWVTGGLRDGTGVYDHAFLICAAMAAVSVVLMSLVRPMRPGQSEIASPPDVH
jgi:sugar phosphate permease